MTEPVMTACQLLATSTYQSQHVNAHG